MRTVRLTLSRSDCLIIDVGRDWLHMGVGALSVATASAIVHFSDTATPMGKFGLVFGAVAFGFAATLLYRSARRNRRIVVKSLRDLLLDGDPLDLARLELRLESRLFGLVAPQYILSLWVMTLAGPEELQLGVYPTLIDASRVSGELEEFLQKGSLKPHRVS